MSAVINLTKALRIMPEFTICPTVDRSKRNEDKFPIPHTQEVSGAGRRWHLLAQLFHQLLEVTDLEKHRDTLILQKPFISTHKCVCFPLEFCPVKAGTLQG